MRQGVLSSGFNLLRLLWPFPSRPSVIYFRDDLPLNWAKMWKFETLPPSGLPLCTVNRLVLAVREGTMATDKSTPAPAQF